MPKSRTLRGILLLSCGAILGAEPSFAQPGQATPDTSGVFGFLRPTYNSSYDITRQATKWLQNFSFKNQWNGITVDNNTSYSVQTDPGANLKARGGSTSTSLNFTVANYVPVTVDMNYSRNGTDNATSTTGQTTIDSGVKATYNQRFFRKASTSLVGGIGFVNRKTTNTYSGNLSGSKELGLSQDLNANGTFNGPLPGMVLKLNTSFNAVRTTPEVLNPSPGAPPKNTNTNTRNVIGLNATWSPFTGVTTDAAFTRNQANQHYIVTSIDRNNNNREELATDNNFSFNSSLNYKPAGNRTDFRAELRTSHTDARRRVEKERASQGQGLSVDARLKQVLMGTTFILHGQNSKDISTSFVLGTDTTLTRAVDLSVETPWTKVLTTKVIGELRLRSLKYDGEGLQDFDSLKNRVEASLFYRIWSKLSASLSGRRVADDGVYIHETQSISSRLEETYGTNASLTYAFSSRTQITQKYDFTALFTSFEFDSAQSTIQRTRSVNTGITTDLSRTIEVGLNHTYFFQETGGYRRDEAGSRLFARGNLKYRQELRTSVTYKPKDWLSFSTEERLYRTDDIRVVNGNRTTSAQLTFTQRGSLKRPIPGGGNFSCDMTFDIQKFILPFAADPERFFAARLSLDKSF